jgi:2TM domain
MIDQTHETERALAGIPESTEASERAEVRRHLEARREFFRHLLVYVIVNTAVVLIWVTTGSGYFWPAWLMGLWGIGLVMHAWDIFLVRPITESDVDEELRKLHENR